MDYIFSERFWVFDGHFTCSVYALSVQCMLRVLSKYFRCSVNGHLISIPVLSLMQCLRNKKTSVQCMN